MSLVIHLSTHSRSRTGQDPVAGNAYGWHAQLGRAVAERTPYRVECWSIDRAASATAREERDRLVYRLFPADRSLTTGRETSSALLRELWRLQTTRPILIHVHDVHTWQAYAILRTIRRAPIVGHHHGASRPPGARLGGGRRLLAAPLFLLEQAVENRALRSLRHCFTVNRNSAAYFERRGVPTSFCPMAPDLDAFEPLPRREVQRELGLPEAAPLLLSAGGFVRRKGLELLVNVFQRLPSHTRLAIIGHTYDRTYRLAIEQQLARHGLTERTSIIDQLPRTALNRWYHAADALLVTSTADEGGPVGILEACHVGLPVVTTPVGFVHDVAPRSNGLVTVAPADPAAFASAVTALLTHPPHRQPTDIWTWDDAVAAVLPVYERLLGQARA